MQAQDLWFHCLSVGLRGLGFISMSTRTCLDSMVLIYYYYYFDRYYDYYSCSYSYIGCDVFCSCWLVTVATPAQALGHQTKTVVIVCTLP